MAQKEGFEPSRVFYAPTPLAGEPLRPLGYFCMPNILCTIKLPNHISTRRVPCQEEQAVLCSVLLPERKEVPWDVAVASGILVQIFLVVFLGGEEVFERHELYGELSPGLLLLGFIAGLYLRKL